MKLYIQRFADSTTESVDTEKLEEIKKQLETLIADIETNISDIQAIADEVLDSGAFSSTDSKDMKDTLSDVKGFINNNFGTAVASLGTFLSKAIQAYEALDIDYSSAISGWTSTIKDAISKVTGGLNSDIQKGSYTVENYASDAKTSITNISSASKVIVGEVSTMLGNTGKLYTSLTGKTVIATVKEIGQNAVGAIKTLFGNLTPGNATVNKQNY